MGLVIVREALHGSWEHSHSHAHTIAHAITHSHHWVEHGRHLGEEPFAEAAGANFFLDWLFITNYVISYVIDIEFLLRCLYWLHWANGDIWGSVLLV